MAFDIYPKITEEVMESYDILASRHPSKDVAEWIVVDLDRLSVADEIDSDESGVPNHPDLYYKLKIIDPRLDLFSHYLKDPNTTRRIAGVYRHIDKKAKVSQKVVALDKAYKEHYRKRGLLLKRGQITFASTRPPIPSTIDSSIVRLNRLELTDIDDYLIQFVVGEEERYADIFIVAPYYPLASPVTDAKINTLIDIVNKTKNMTEKPVMPVICIQDINKGDEVKLDEYIKKLQELDPEYLGLRIVEFDDTDKGYCARLANLVKKTREMFPKAHIHVFDPGAHGTFGIVLLCLCADSFSFEPCKSTVYPWPQDFIPREMTMNRYFHSQHLVKYRWSERPSSWPKCDCHVCKNHDIKELFYQFMRDQRDRLVQADLYTKQIGAAEVKTKRVHAKMHHLYSIFDILTAVKATNKEESTLKLEQKLQAAIDGGAPDYVEHWLSQIRGSEEHHQS